MKNATPAAERGSRQGESTGRFQPESTASVGHISGDLLDSALDYAETGLRVFPLAPSRIGGKAPLTSNGFKSGTTDPAVIRRWWGKWPDANVGAAVPAGHIVVDLDLYKGAADVLAALEDRLGPLPDTLTCETGGGGEHRWFTVPDLTFRAPGKGIDLRCAGRGYVVMPPSVHVSGGPYVWRDESAPAAPLPAAWVDELASTRPQSATRTTGLPNPRTVGTAAWLASLPAGAPDEAMRVAIGARTLQTAMRDAAHETARDRVYFCLRLGAEGHPGAQRAVGAIMTAFLREFERRRRVGLARAESQAMALVEFERLVSGAAQRIGGSSCEN
ncbi:bifunctional DNA primase/polymerase [Nocardia cerradoensis]|nr:bifunctional DNA primase/polymerase [Nocardia cerradoensis]